MTLLCINTYAQINLVPNPSFEHLTTCDSLSYIQNGLRRDVANSWFSPSKKNPIFVYNECSNSECYKNNICSSWNDNKYMPAHGVPLNYSGFQNPRTGKGYI